MLNRPASFFVAGAAGAATLTAASAPSPLYPVYQRLWGFSAFTLTVIFAVYVFALLAALDLDLLLTSDHEWCTYQELDGISIHQLATGEDDGDDAVTSVRFTWNGSRLVPETGLTEAEPAQP